MGQGGLQPEPVCTTAWWAVGSEQGLQVDDGPQLGVGLQQCWGTWSSCHSGSTSPIPECSILKQLRKALLNAGILRGNMNVRIQHSSIRGEK